jgi:hypothetical protein
MMLHRSPFRVRPLVATTLAHPTYAPVSRG